MFQLRHDTLKITIASEPEKLAPFAVNVPRVQHRRWLLGHYGSQDTLSFDQRQRSHVLTVDPEHVESIERRRATASHEFIKLWPPFAVQTNDLSVKDRLTIHVNVNRGAEVGKGFVDVALSRDEARGVLVNICERSEPVHLQFEDEIAMVKRLR